MRMNRFDLPADDLGQRLLAGASELEISAIKGGTAGCLLLDFKLSGTVAFSDKDPTAAYQLVLDLLQHFHAESERLRREADRRHDEWDQDGGQLQ